MFSALKFVAAAVIVALFGGFLLTGLLTTQQDGEVAPAAVTDSPSPVTTSESSPRITYEPTDDPAVLKVISEPHKDWLDHGDRGLLAIDPDGGVWVQGWSGKRAFLAKLGVPGRIGLGWNEHAGDVWDGTELEFAGDGTLWASTDGGLMSLEGGTWTKHDPTGVIDLTLAPDGVLYGLIEYPTARTTPDGVVSAVGFSIVDGEVTDVEGPWAPRPGKAQALAVTPDGTVWVGGRGRGSGALAHIGSGWLVRYDGQTAEAVRPLGEGIDPNVADLAVGPDGALWALMRTEAESYLGRYDGEAWSIFSTADGLPAVGVLPLGLSAERMAVGPDGRVWFIKLGAQGENEGLVAFDGQRFQRYLVDAGVRDFAVATDGSAWTDTGKGIYVIKPEAVAASE
jgi:hypothetical protein